MKIALCYSGNFRTFNECSLLNYNFFKELSDCIDVYFSTWEENKYALILNDHKHFFCKERIPETERITIDLIEKFIPKEWNLKDVKIESYNEKKINNYDSYTPKEQGLLCQYYKIKDCFSLLKKEENYDVIFRIRPDVVLNNKIDKSFLKKIIEDDQILFDQIVWQNYSFTGREINEMFWCSNYETMEKSIKIYDNFSKIKEMIPNSLYGEIICYTNLKLENIQNKIKVYDFNYNVIR